MRDHFFKVTTIFKTLIGIIFLCSLFVCGCQSKKVSNFHEEALAIKQGLRNSTIHHAVGFDLVNYDGFKILHILRHYNDSADTLGYVFHKKGAIVPLKFSAYQQIETPVDRIALLHSSYLAFFEFCEATNRLKAISEAKYVYDQQIYTEAQNGLVPEVGYGESLDKEKLLELGIAVVITVGFPNTPNKSQQVLEDLGIPVLVFSDWQESTLLGRAEWVKVIAALTDSEDLCDTKFMKVENEYKRLKSLTANIENRATILCNLPYKGAWYVPGGNSYISNVLYDAGANYLWSEEKGTGGIQIDFEAVYARGLNADFWINPDFAFTKEEIIAKDERLKDFLPIKTGKIYNNNNRVVRTSANDYWESGITNPHIILADLIRIINPGLLPEHQLVYYRQVD